MSAPRVSIVVPCFNEGTRILATVETLLSWLDASGEVVAIDDGSGDDTLEQLRVCAARHPRVRAHGLAKNVGKGGAIRAAIPLVRGELVILTDADLAFDRESVLRIVSGLERADMVVGNRRHHESRYSVPVRLFGFLYRRHLVGMTFNACVRALLQVGIRDTQCGLKGFRREALLRMAPSLSTDGFALDVEMLLVARALELRLADAPVQVTYHSAATSVRLVRSAVAMAGELLRLLVRRAAGAYDPARVNAAAARAAGPPSSPPPTTLPR